jgi:uncharacterized protein with FMN-binding domain
MKKKKGKALIVVGIIVAVIVLIFAGGYIAVTRGLPEMQELVVNDVNPGELPDGIYTGEFSRYRWSNKVKVTIEDGRILDLQPESSGALEQDLAERIIARQSLQVDIETGATVSSKAFLKAVEEALSP